MMLSPDLKGLQTLPQGSRDLRLEVRKQGYSNGSELEHDGFRCSYTGALLQQVIARRNKKDWEVTCEISLKLCIGGAIVFAAALWGAQLEDDVAGSLYIFAPIIVYVTLNASSTAGSAAMIFTVIYIGLAFVTCLLLLLGAIKSVAGFEQTSESGGSNPGSEANVSLLLFNYWSLVICAALLYSFFPPIMKQLGVAFLGVLTFYPSNAITMVSPWMLIWMLFAGLIALLLGTFVGFGTVEALVRTVTRADKATHRPIIRLSCTELRVIALDVARLLEQAVFFAFVEYFTKLRRTSDLKSLREISFRASEDPLASLRLARINCQAAQRLLAEIEPAMYLQVAFEPWAVRAEKTALVLGSIKYLGATARTLLAVTKTLESSHKSHMSSIIRVVASSSNRTHDDDADDALRDRMAASLAHTCDTFAKVGGLAQNVMQRTVVALETPAHDSDTSALLYLVKTCDDFTELERVLANISSELTHSSTNSSGSALTAYERDMLANLQESSQNWNTCMQLLTMATRRLPVNQISSKTASGKVQAATRALLTMPPKWFRSRMILGGLFKAVCPSKRPTCSTLREYLRFAGRPTLAIAIAGLWPTISFLSSGLLDAASSGGSMAFQQLSGEVAMTVGIVWVDERAGFLHKCIERALGTLLGVFVSWLYFFYIPSYDSATLILVGALAFPLFFIIGRLNRDHFYVATAAATGFVVTIFDAQNFCKQVSFGDTYFIESSDGRALAMQILQARIFATMTGIAIALIVGCFFFPKTAEQEWYSAASHALSTYAKFIGQVAGDPLGALKPLVTEIAGGSESIPAPADRVLVSDCGEAREELRIKGELAIKDVSLTGRKFSPAVADETYQSMILLSQALCTLVQERGHLQSLATKETVAVQELFTAVQALLDLLADICREKSEHFYCAKRQGISEEAHQVYLEVEQVSRNAFTNMTSRIEESTCTQGIQMLHCAIEKLCACIYWQTTSKHLSASSKPRVRTK